MRVSDLIFILWSLLCDLQLCFSIVNTTDSQVGRGKKIDLLFENMILRYDHTV